MPQVPWGSTLRLPKSSFPPRAILADRKKYLRRCTDDLYAWQRNAADPSPTNSFTLHDGPPYANGSLHIGHALNKILKDITCRFQVSSGRRVDYRPGWDCHGLPIELKALQRQKELGQSGEDRQLGFTEVRKLARKLASDTVEEQKAGFRKWAVMADWDNSWKTMDRDFELKQLDVFKSLVKKGLIYRKFKPVYWSPSSRTALAEAELEYKSDHVSTAAFVKFPLLDLPQGITSELGTSASEVSAVIWTTTPWTLVANKAIAVNSALEYVLVRSSRHGLLLLAETRLEDFSKVCEEDLHGQIVSRCRGSELVSGTYRHSAFADHSSLPILHADFVSADSGSGLVHIAPGHGMDDYKLCLEQGVLPFAPVDEYGCFTEDAFPSDPQRLQGKDVLGQGNKAVLQLLVDRDMIIASHKYSHKYPYDWRSKQPVIIRATQQWFANVGELRADSLKALDEVNFVPQSGRERLSSFVQGRSEWCISRQRAWGVPIPTLYEKDSGTTLLTPQSVSYIVSVIRERGIEAWWTDDELEPAWVPPMLRDNSQFRRGKDTMDVWFDSGTSWTQMEDGSQQERPPVADVYLEGTDQHRGWFQSSLLTHTARQSSNVKKVPFAPYKTLITHGFTLDHLGRKMSKSEGNVISPSEIMDGTLLPPVKRKSAKNAARSDQTVFYDAMGPDALRLWVGSCDFTRDIIVGQPVLKAINNSLLKLRNTFKLLLGLVDTLKPEQRARFESLGSANRMALVQLATLEAEAQRAYSRYEYHKVVTAVNQYINVDLSASYIESIKDCLYADATNSRNRVETQLVLWEIFKGLSCILSPITPLLIEEAIDHLPAQLAFQPMKVAWGQDPSVLQSEQDSSIPGPWEVRGLEEDMQYLSAVRNAIRSLQEPLRAEKKMGSSLQCTVAIYLPDDPLPASPQAGSQSSHTLRAALERNLLALEDYFVVSKVELISTNSPPPPPPPTDHNSSNDPNTWSRSTPLTLNNQTSTIHVRSPDAAKCVRCWKYVVPVAASSNPPDQQPPPLSPPSPFPSSPPHSSSLSPKPQLQNPSSSLDDAQEESLHDLITSGSLSRLGRELPKPEPGPELPQPEEPLCQRCLGVLEGLLHERPEIFEGRPGIEAAARRCREVEDSGLRRRWELG